MHLQAQDQEAQNERDAAFAARAAAIQGLANMVGDPQDLWQAAVQLAKTYTAASGGQGSQVTVRSATNPTQHAKMADGRPRSAAPRNCVLRPGHSF